MSGTGDDKAVKKEWVENVLGIRFGVARQPLSMTAMKSWQEACNDFQGAVDTVSAGIEQLRLAVAEYGRQEEDDELIDLARRSDFGINGFTENTFVRLRKSLLEARGSDPAKLKVAIVSVVKSAEAVQLALQGSEQVAAADDNPFDVSVDIAGTLVPALSRLVTVGEDVVAA